MVRLVATLVFLCCLALPASALQVSPLVIEMDSTGRSSRAALTVVNPTARPMPVEVDVARFIMDQNGAISETPNDSDFLIFPPQAIIAPYGRQIVRLQWLGDPVLENSQHYYVTAKQVPVDPETDEQFVVQLVFNIRSLVSVKPPQGDPALSVQGAGIERNSENRAVVWALIRNDANVHAAIGQSDVTLRVYDAGGNQIWAFEPSDQDLGVRVGHGIVPARGMRRYTFPFELPQDVAARASRATVEIDASRPR